MQIVSQDPKNFAAKYLRF